MHKPSELPRAQESTSMENQVEDMDPMKDTGTSQEPVPNTQPHSQHQSQQAAAHTAGHETPEVNTTPEPMAHPVRSTILAVLVVLLIAFLIYRGIHSRARSEATLEQHTDATSTPTVRTTHAGGGGEAAEVTLPGNVTAFIDTPIYARTSGYLRHWYFDIGQQVHQGALLAVIESPEVDQQVAQAEADLKTAQSNLNIAQITSTRWDKLVAKNAVSKQEADQATSSLASSKSTLASQQANLDRVKHLQDFERIYAPFDGVITARNTDVGALIQAGDNSVSKELFHLSAVHKLRVFVPVPEADQSAVHDGQHVLLTSDAFPGVKFDGVLARNSRAVDVASRTLNVEVDIDNTTGKLLPGAYVFAHFHVPAATESMTLPANTLLFRKEGLRVGVVENGRVTLRPITIGHDYGATVEILSGLTASDNVILDPSDSLESGDIVQMQAPQQVAGGAPQKTGGAQ